MSSNSDLKEKLDMSIDRAENLRFGVLQTIPSNPSGTLTFGNLVFESAGIKVVNNISNNTPKIRVNTKKVGKYHKNTINLSINCEHKTKSNQILDTVMQHLNEYSKCRGVSLYNIYLHEISVDAKHDINIVLLGDNICKYMTVLCDNNMNNTIYVNEHEYHVKIDRGLYHNEGRTRASLNLSFFSIYLSKQELHDNIVSTINMKPDSLQTVCKLLSLCNKCFRGFMRSESMKTQSWEDIYKFSHSYIDICTNDKHERNNIEHLIKHSIENIFGAYSLECKKVFKECQIMKTDIDIHYTVNMNAELVERKNTRSYFYDNICNYYTKGERSFFFNGKLYPDTSMPDRYNKPEIKTLVSISHSTFSDNSDSKENVTPISN